MGPLCQEQRQESSWDEGFGLADFEDFATVRRGSGANVKCHQGSISEGTVQLFTI